MPTESPRPGAPSPGSAPAVRPAACTAGTTRGAARESVRRLTRAELAATLADLFPIGTTLNADLDQVSDDADYLGTFSPLYSEDQITSWLGIADKVGGLASTDVKVRAAFSSDACLAAAVTSECWQRVLRPFLRRTWRRPPTDAEVTAAAAYVTGKDAATGIRAAVTRALMSPDFLFRIESGAASEQVRVRLTDHEIAARISYATVGSMPDAMLAAAADAGQLQELGQVEAHVRRLIETPRAQQKVTRFFAEWSQAGDINAPEPRVFTYWGKLPGKAGDAAAAFEKEVDDFTRAVVWKERGAFGDLMSKRASYSASPVLQAVYGAAPTAAGAAYATPEHAGLPLRAGFMVEPDLDTSPIRRGARFLRRFLCQDLPAPDPVALAQAQQALMSPALDPHTTPNYKRVTAVTAAPGCQVCHGRINAVGFVFESYDQLGRKRSVETYIEDVKGTLKTDVTHPLPGAIANLDLAPGLPTTFSSATDLIDAVSKSAVARDCMSAFMMRNLEQRQETDLDRCALDEASGLLGQGRPVVDAFVRSIANEDIFWRGV